MTHSKGSLSKLFYTALFVVSFSLLASEILLTRILSVIFWHHFAFLIISVSLFGLTIGALIIYLFPKSFAPDLTMRHLALYAYISSFFIMISFLSLFYLPAALHQLNLSFLLMPALYFLLSLPFVATGICLSLSLTRFPEHIGKIYSINLCGSASGTIGIIFILTTLNAPAAIAFIAALCVLSALLFSYASQLGRTFRLFCLLTISASILFSYQYAHSITPLWLKGSIQLAPPFYGKWNYFSYITVRKPARKPFGWGFSPKISEAKVNTKELMLVIDEGAGTVLTRFDNLAELGYLGLDISAIAYNISNNNDVLVLGAGGGRDLLTALLFGANRVVGVEINEDIVDIAVNKLRWFSPGMFDNGNRIQLIVDEGRSYVSRSEKKYDIIQASLVDSFAAFSNGAFALTENSLYTSESWKIFLNHLKEHGILTFSRWYDYNNPSEIYRIIALAKSSLIEIGINNPRQHIMLVSTRQTNNSLGVGTILVSRSPFSYADISKLEKAADNLSFDLVLSPRSFKDANFITIIDGIENNDRMIDYPFNISPPVDDKPFFFYYGKFKDLFSKNPADSGAKILRKLFIMTLFFGIIFLLVPVFYKNRREGLKKISISIMIYFTSIGMGFMLLEISFMQRFGIFLGHPIYGLTVVLFSLLTACGVGSYLTKYLNSKVKIILPFMASIITVFIIVNLLPIVMEMATPNSMQVKILISLVVLILIGVPIGMPFPIGIKMAGNNNAPLIVYWGVNGFASVVGSVLAAILLVNFGFQKTLLGAIACYGVALLSLYPHLASKKFE